MAKHATHRTFQKGQPVAVKADARKRGKVIGQYLDIVTVRFDHPALGTGTFHSAELMDLFTAADVPDNVILAQALLDGAEDCDHPVERVGPDGLMVCDDCNTVFEPTAL